MSISYQALRDRPAGPCQRTAAAAIWLVALLSFAACAKTHAGADADSVGPATAVPVASLNCRSVPDAAPGHLPDHVWVAVALCPFTMVYVIPGGEATPSLTPQPPRLLHGDLQPLVAALHQPDAPPARLCTAEFVMLPPFWLVDRDATAYLPAVPKDPCGRPSAAVTAALDKLR